MLDFLWKWNKRKNRRNFIKKYFYLFINTNFKNIKKK